MSTKPVLQRLRLHYRKDEVLMYIGHLDLMRFIYRCFRRSAFPYATWGHFSPKPCVTFGPTVSLGLLADNEAIDVEIREGSEIPIEAFPEWLQKLQDCAAPRDCFKSITQLEPDTLAIARAAVSARYRIRLAEPGLSLGIDPARVKEAMQEPLVAEDRGKERDLAAAIQDWSFEGDTLSIVGSCSGSLHFNAVLLAGLIEARSGLQTIELRRVELLDSSGNVV
jgi:radical SAM-linked protein